MPEVQLPAEVRTWLSSTADLLQGRSCFWGTTDGWSASEGSHARWELDEAESADWGDPRPPTIVQQVLLDYWDGADGHLSSIEALARSGAVTHSLPLLTRTVLEHAHRICWLLEASHPAGSGKEGPVMLTERAARAYLEELHSLHHRRETVKKLAGRSSEAFKTCDGDLREMRTTRIPAVFASTADLDGDPSQWRISGERWRGPTSLAEWYTKHKGQNPGQSGTYDALSAMSHPTLYGLRESIEFHPVEGGVVRRRSLPQDFLSRVIGGAAATYWRACMDLASYFGWDREPLDRWASQLNEWSPGIIAGGP